jgi:hypothetical protein
MASFIDRPMRRLEQSGRIVSWWILALTLLATTSGCAGSASWLTSGSKCSDQCSTMSCPDGMYCNLGADCTPHCQGTMK